MNYSVLIKGAELPTISIVGGTPALAGEFPYLVRANFYDILFDVECIYRIMFLSLSDCFAFKRLFVRWYFNWT